MMQGDAISALFSQCTYSEEKALLFDHLRLCAGKEAPVLQS